MSQSFEPGSIKDRVLIAVGELGTGATRTAIHRALDANDAILSIAIAGLVRDGYMHETRGGWFELGLAEAASAPASSDVSEVEADLRVQRRVCRSCEQEKDEADFYRPADRQCKACVLRRQKARRIERLGASGVLPAEKPAASSASPTGKRAMGEVRYTHLTPGTELSVDDAKQLLSHDGACQIINHTAEIQISYLIELPNGERRWMLSA